MDNILQSLANSGAIKVNSDPPANPEVPASPEIQAPAPETPAAPEVKTDPPPSSSPEAPFLNGLKEKFGREFQTVDELEAFFAETRIPDDPMLHSLSDYVKKGGSIDDWYKTQRTDWGKLAESSPDEVLFHHAKLTNEGLTDDEIRFELDMKYPTDAEKHPELSESAIKQNSIAKKRALQDAVKYLNEVKVREATPPAARNREAQEKAFAQAVQEAATRAKSLQEIKVADFSYKLPWKDEKGATPENMKSVAEYIDNPMKFISEIVSDKGINVERIAKLAALEANLELIAKSYADAKVAAEIKNLQQGIVNPQARVREPAPAQDREEINKIVAMMKGIK